MKLNYDVTLEDILVFARFHHDSSPFVRRQKRLIQWGVVAVFALLAVVAWLMTRVYSLTIGCVGGGLFFALIWQPWYRRYLEKATLKMYGEGSNQGILGEHELELTGTGLLEKNASSESKLSWGAIKRVEEIESHAFIYTSAVTAYVVPRKRVTGGDFDAFIAALKTRRAEG